jgi:hypothetical protein
MITFVYVDLEAGLLFASLARQAETPARRYRLKTKSLKAYEAVTRFLPRVQLSDSDRNRLEIGLTVLKDEIENISQEAPATPRLVVSRR